MKVLNLHCSHQHAFEGWFGSEDDYQAQRARGLVSCPLCGCDQIQKMPSAPRLNLKAAKGRAAPQTAPAPPTAEAAPSAPAVPSAPIPPELQALQQAVFKHMRQALRHSTDVGERFADEARRIHHGESKEKAIHGVATPEQAEALLEEGIAVLPLPPAFKETLQ